MNVEHFNVVEKDKAHLNYNPSVCQKYYKIVLMGSIGIIAILKLEEALSCVNMNSQIHYLCAGNKKEYLTVGYRWSKIILQIANHTL